jgi:hypothetical protein
MSNSPADSLEEIGLAAVDRFITTWNSRDPVAWAASLKFPHVRPSPFGEILVAKDSDEYVSRVDFDRVVATGWDHSEWDYRQVFQVSPSKIHVVGQWSRFNADGEKILTNPVVYVVTHVDGAWGIQSRFGADFAGDEDTTSMESRAFKLIELFAIHANNRNRDAAASVLNFPHFLIGNGEVTETTGAEDFSLPEGTIKLDSMLALQTGRRSCNVGVDVTFEREQGVQSLQGVINVTEREDHLGIQAWSFLDPNERAPDA